MKKINEYTYKKILKINPLLVKRTKGGFYVLRDRKDIPNKKKAKEDRRKFYNNFKRKGEV